MKRLAMILALILLLNLLCGCTGSPKNEKKIYSATFLTLFDTVTTVRGTAESEERFNQIAQSICDELEQYHQLFDIYNEYEGLANLKTVNDEAGIRPVQVDGRIIDLLSDCKTYYELTGGKVNVAMGSVLRLWHEERNHGLDDPANAALPELEMLQTAAEHCSFEDVIIDREASTVYLADPMLRLDVGAVAKGWAAQRVAETAPEGLLISVGGNVCATGAKDEAGTPWVIGVQDPDSSGYLHTLAITLGSAVTSGDYQRAYMVNGQMYHHIIDPETLFPATGWRSVTIVCDDSGLADALSTALFLMDEEAGLRLLEACDALAMWVSPDGNVICSPGFEALIRS